MSNNSAKRREWIKNAAIVFLTILLLLTFFSNTILNYSLPEVSAQYAQYGSLSTAVKASGTIKANASYNVVYEADVVKDSDDLAQSRKVVSVFVKEGDYIEKDAVIMELKGGTSDTLASVQSQYDQKKQEYDIAMLQWKSDSLTSSSALTDAQKALTNAQETLAKLQKNYTDLLAGVDTSTILESQIENLQNEIDNIEEYKTEISTKIAECESIIGQYQSDISKDIYSDLTTAEKLRIAKDDYETLKKSYDKLKSDVDFYKERYDKLTNATTDLSEANTLTKTLKEYEKKLDTAEADLDSLNKDIDIAKNALIKAQFELKDYQNGYSDALKKYTVLQDEYETAKRNLYNADKTDENYAELEQACKDAKAALDALQPVIDGSSAKELEVGNAQNSYDELIAKRKDCYNLIDELEKNISETKTKLNVIGMPEVDDLADYTIKYDIEAAKKDYDKASADLQDIEAKYTEAKTKYETLSKSSTAEGKVEEYTTLKATYNEQLKDLEKTKTSKEKEIEKLKKDLDDNNAITPEDLEAKIKEARETVSTSQVTVDKQKISNEIQSTQTNTTLENAKKELDKLQSKIEAFATAPENTQVKAPIAGRIVSVTKVPGESVTSGETVASIEIADKGYICEISMASDQARRIQVGSPCTVVNSWWYTNIEASVTNIRSDAQSQGKNRIITISVTGDVYEGQQVTFSIGDKSQSYDCVLPNSAIREDKEGKFVLVVDQKKVPLGTRYTARRVEIKVLASDDTQSAVSGLMGNEFVITNATSPISDKQQVRLPEN